MLRRWWHWLLLGIGVVMLLISVAVGAQYYARWQAQQELDEAIAQVDAVDPRWRLGDIEADRRVVRPEESAALVVVAAHGLLPAKWDGLIADELDKVPPPVELHDKLAAQVAAELQAAAPAVAQARTLKDLPFGRHRLDYTPDFVSTLVPDQQGVRLVARLLDLDTCAAVHQKDMVRAWESNRALLNAGRSLGDEPLLISGLVRLAIDAMTVRSLERALAQGEMAPAHLVERQRVLAEEATISVFLLGIRGERAGNDLLFTNIESGKLPLMNTLENLGSARRPPLRWSDGFYDFFAGSMVLRSHATLIRFETEMAEAAKLPEHERYEALQKVDLAIRAQLQPHDRSQILARLLLPAVVKIAEAEQRGHTHLACAVAGLAAERFRLAHHRWPASLDEMLRAGFLERTPIDLFDGNPLHLRATTNGLVIYSIGKDGFYDGKALDDLDDADPGAIRTEFRLWDPAQRRRRAPVQPAEPLNLGND